MCLHVFLILNVKSNFPATQNFKLLFAQFYLLLSSDPSTIRLSSSMVRISVVSAPFSISSPLSLNVFKLNVCTDQTSFTCVNLASISFSFTADMQMSYRWRKPSLRGWIQMNRYNIVATKWDVCLNVTTLSKLRANLNIFFVFQQRCFHDVL